MAILKPNKATILRKWLYNKGYMDSEYKISQFPKWTPKWIRKIFTTDEEIMRIPPPTIQYINPNKLKPTHKHIVKNEQTVKNLIEAMKRNKTIKPLLISNKNEILDGHHRYMAAKLLNQDIPIVRLTKKQTTHANKGGVIAFEYRPQ